MSRTKESDTRVTPSGVVIDASVCGVGGCENEATHILGFWVLVGPIELPVCDEHMDVPGMRQRDQAA